nr:hypothetical protein [Butyrivibrio sp. MC2013]
MRNIPYHIRFKQSYLLTGLVIAGVYAEFWSLFGGVSFQANLILVILSLSAYLVYGHRLYLMRQYIWTNFREQPLWQYLAYIVVFVFLAYCVSHGYEHYDTGLYHAQAIHWNETYGAVKGLGNFNQRLAYNSAFFPLQALYSFSWLGGGSLHTMAGYFALLLGWKCVDLRRMIIRGYPSLADAVRFAALYYLFNIADEVISPASDFPVMCLVLYIFIAWLELNRERERSIYPYAMLSVLSVYAITIKLSAAPMILFAIRPIYKIVKDSRISKGLVISFFTILGLVASAAFFIRNVILSGWLIYPVTAIDLFDLPWKIPKEVAILDSREIRVYGRGFTDPSLYNMHPGQWFPVWFKGLGLVDKMAFIGDIIALIFMISMGAYFYYMNRKIGIAQKQQTSKLTRLDSYKILSSIKDETDHSFSKVVFLSKRRRASFVDYLYAQTIAYIALFFWLFSAPLARYGPVYLWLPLVLILGRSINAIHYVAGPVKNSRRILLMLLGCFLIWKMTAFTINDIQGTDLSYLVCQQDYASFDTEYVEEGGVRLYYAAEGDRTGYEPFPSTPYRPNVSLMGDDLSSGFIRR